MGIRFQRSIRLAPGLRLNLSKSGLGLSAGVRGLKVGIDSKGRKYSSIGIPGTGLSSRQYFRQNPETEIQRAQVTRPRPGTAAYLAVAAFGAIMTIAVMVLLVTWISR